MGRFNFDEFLCLLVFILLDIAICYLVFTGKIEFYIGKKMIKYAYITIVMLSIIACFQFQNIFTFQRNSNLKLKLLPIIVAIILGVISINNQKTFKHNELNKEFKESNRSSIDKNSLYEHEVDYSAIREDNIKEETLIVNESNPMVLDDVRINPEKYIGRELEISGFVCKENYLKENQFIIGRIIMNCCAADSKVVGIIGEYDKAYELKENEKIIVKGIIGSSSIKDDSNISHKVPILIIEKLEKCYNK